MKYLKTILFLTIIFCGKYSFAKNTNLSNVVTDTSLAQLNTLLIKCDSLNKIIVTETAKVRANQKQNLMRNRHSLSFLQKMLVLLPVILFLFFIIVTIFILRADKYNLGEALSYTKIVTNEADKGNKITVNSSSRLIAFISAIASVVIVICFCCYYAYFSISQSEMPEVKHFVEIVVVLGIGVVPYGFSRFSEKKDVSNKV